MLAGVITFLTMSYIIFVQPAVLSGEMFGKSTGMDFGAIMVATCLATAFASAFMGLWARYPIAQAPGMGENFFFVFSAIPAAAAAGFSNAWSVALGVIFWSGILFLLLSISGVRELMINAISPSMKNGIAVGIGLFIAFIGLQNGQLVIKSPDTAVALSKHLTSPDLIIFFLTLLVTGALHARRVRGSILWGILFATLLAVAFRLVVPHLSEAVRDSKTISESLVMTRFSIADHVLSMPPSITPTLFKMNLKAALSATMLPFILIFLIMNLFDTLGTLIGVSEQAGFIKENKLPRAHRALISDAAGTVAASVMGTSTVTSYIESAAGVEQGGRTGLTAVTVALLFIAALFFSPIIAMVGSYPPITAPALVIVGSMMMQNVTKIDWSDFSELIPSFIIIIGIPLTYSIADGLALGFIAYPIIKLLSGKGRDVKWLMYLMAVILLAYFALLR